MTEFTEEKLAELRAVAEAATYRAEPLADDVLELLDALEAANESNPSNSVTSGSANERELADLRAALEAKAAEVDDLAADPGHKAAKYWKWWQREKARADRAEASVRYATSRMIDTRTLLQQMADRIDPFVFDELASELDDQPMDANGDTFEHRLVRAEAALERVRALHPRKEFDDSPGKFYCDACQRTAGLWPCPTVQAIEGADQ